MDLQGGLQVAMTSKVPFSDYTIHSLKVTQVCYYAMHYWNCVY